MKTKGLTSKQMSKLHWNLRKKGYRPINAFKTTGIAKKLSMRKYDSKWSKGKFGKYRNLDFDGDGKVNKYDCQPFDKNRQDKYNFETLVKYGMNDVSKKKSDKQLGTDLLSKPSSIKEYDKAVKKGSTIYNVNRKKKKKSITQKDKENYGWLKLDELKDHIANREAGKRIGKATLSGMKTKGKERGFIFPENKLAYTGKAEMKKKEKRNVNIRKTDNIIIKEKGNVRTTFTPTKKSRAEATKRDNQRRKAYLKSKMQKASQSDRDFLMTQNLEKLSNSAYQDNERFWKAQEMTRQQLKKKGLY